MPTDPFEAELLMMAEMVAGEKKKAESDSESEEDAPGSYLFRLNIQPDCTGAHYTNRDPRRLIKPKHYLHYVYTL